MAIREQAGDWSRPEAEEDAPRQTRERIFYDLVSQTHTHSHSPCLLACHTNQVNTPPLNAFVSQLSWMAHSLFLLTSFLSPLTSFSFPVLKTPSLSLYYPLTHSRHFLTLSVESRVICYDLISQKGTLIGTTCSVDGLHTTLRCQTFFS